VPEHYFTPATAAAHRPRTVQLVLPDLHLSLETDSGMFSPDRLDKGTRVLLETVPAPPAAGDLLDLGCGYGPIALAMAARSAAAHSPGAHSPGAHGHDAHCGGATVWAVDVNTRALELCARNAARAGLRNVHAVTAAEVPADVTFAVIWSNPPIRIGKLALHDLLTTWLSRLAPGGVAYLVTQRHLGADSLQRWLAGEGWEASRIRSRSAYRVLRVAGPGRLPRLPALGDIAPSGGHHGRPDGPDPPAQTGGEQAGVTR
jgi:16S rRNA (guanine1207-N2)-methyltransferase